MSTLATNPDFDDESMKRIVGAVPAEMRTGEPCQVCGSTLDPVYLAARP